MVTASRPVNATSPGQAVLKTPAVSSAWQLGTILNAIALGDSQDGLVRLQIGSRVVTAQTSLPLQSGQALRLQVAETGRTVVLKSLDGGDPEPIRAAMRQNLPRQLPQVPLLAAALSVARTGTQYPPELRNVVNGLVSVMRGPDSLSQGQGLQQSVRDSGVFMEARLAQATAGTTHQPASLLIGDWKAALLRFQHQLSQLQIKLPGETPARLSPAGGAPTANAGVSSTPVQLTTTPPQQAISANPAEKPPGTPTGTPHDNSNRDTHAGSSTNRDTHDNTINGNTNRDTHASSSDRDTDRDTHNCKPNAANASTERVRWRGAHGDCATHAGRHATGSTRQHFRWLASRSTERHRRVNS